MKIFCKSQDKLLVLDDSTIKTIIQEQTEIRIRYSLGYNPELGGEDYDNVILKFPFANLAEEKMREFYRACSKDAKCFFF